MVLVHETCETCTWRIKVKEILIMLTTFILACHLQIIFHIHVTSMLLQVSWRCIFGCTYRVTLYAFQQGSWLVSLELSLVVYTSLLSAALPPRKKPRCARPPVPPIWILRLQYLVQCTFKCNSTLWFLHIHISLHDGAMSSNSKL